MRHVERMEMVLEMIKNGKNDDEIVSFFEQFEDFDKSRTKQQILNLRRRGFVDEGL